ncbi:MAG: hypothetical protein J6B81_05805 [Spirochaetaceae bacterium]|nr:hypothetical protein [Spirochaetaceae bacterium]
MENKGIKFISICLALLFSAAVVFFIASIVIEYKKSPVQTQNTLTKFVTDTKTASEYYSTNTQEFADILRARIASTQSIAVVTIKQGGQTVFAYPVSSPYISANSKGEPQITTSSILVKTQSNTTDLGGTPSIITAAIYTISPDILYSHTRIVFLIVLAGTLIAALALLYIYLVSPQSEKDTLQNDDFSEEHNYEVSQDLDFSFSDSLQQTERNDSDSKDFNPPIDSDFPKAEYVSEDEELGDLKKNFDSIPEPEKEDSSPSDLISTPHDSSSTEEKPFQSVASEPSGLFSPVTGFGWESYLESRLDSELVRSASSEEDIALLLVRIQGLDRTSDVAHKIYDQILDYFKFRDLIFEYKTDGFSCILNSLNVDAALNVAEQLYSALTKTLSEAGQSNEVGIGISTRSFRLIPSRRLFTEAEQALNHSFEEQDTAIVAFRVDPDKYRKYISEYTV